MQETVLATPCMDVDESATPAGATAAVPASGISGLVLREVLGEYDMVSGLRESRGKVRVLTLFLAYASRT